MNFNINTSRLTMKVLIPQSASLVLDFYIKNQEHFKLWEPSHDNNFYTKSYQKIALEYEYNQILNLKFLRYYVFLNNNFNFIIGTISFNNIQKGALKSCNIGYRFDKNFCGYGFAYEAISTLIPLIFNDYQLHRIEAFIMPSNIPSLNLISKLGFLYEGICKQYAKVNGIWQDHERYSLICE